MIESPNGLTILIMVASMIMERDTIFLNLLLIYKINVLLFNFIGLVLRLFVVCFFFYGFVFFNVHYMFLLVLLELILFGVFLSFCFGNLASFGYPVLFLFLLVIVCMGGFGVSLLVRVSRSVGKDY